MLYRVILVDDGSPHVEAFREIGDALTESINTLGGTARCEKQPLIWFKSYQAAPDERWIVLGLCRAPFLPLPAGTIIYNAEQIDSPWFYSQELVRVMNQFTVWEYSPINATRYADVGLNPPVHVVPIRYSPCFIKLAEPLPQKVDVLHVGVVNARRASVLQALQQSGLTVKAVSNLYGNDRDRELMSCRLLLNVHLYDQAICEAARLQLAICNRVPVLSENCAGDESPKGVTYCHFDGLVAKARELLSRKLSGEPAWLETRKDPMVDYVKRALA